MSLTNNKIVLLRKLKWGFLASLIVATLAFIMLIVTLSLQSAGLIDDNPRANALYFVDIEIIVLRFVVVIVIAAMLFVHRNLCKKIKIATYLCILAALLMIISFIFELAISVPYLGSIISLVAGILYAVSLYIAFEGIFENRFNKNTRNPLHQIIVFALILLVVNQILLFVATTFRMVVGFNLALVFIGSTSVLISNLILFFSTKEIVKRITNVIEDKIELEGVK